MADANRDDKIVSIRSKFGMWGIGVYWTLVEKAAEQMKGKMPTPVAVLSVNETVSLCKCKRNKLVSFLFALQKQRGIKYELNGDILKIEIKKLLEIKDNYLSDLEETSKRLPIKEVEEEVEVDKERDREVSEAIIIPLQMPPTLTAVDGFQEVWMEWEAERRLKKKPLTDRARKMQWKFLMTTPNPKAVVEASIQNGWQGLFPLKEQNGKGNGAVNRQNAREVFDADTLKRLIERTPPSS
jgi:hypothetical protein